MKKMTEQTTGQVIDHCINKGINKDINKELHSLNILRVLKTLGFALVVLFNSARLIPPVAAHPVFYSDGWGLMAWNNPMMTEAYFARTFSHRLAVGLRYFGYRDAKSFPSTNYYLTQISYLLKRWNNPASQANIYFSVAPGTVFSEAHNEKAFALYSALDLDWENRRYYTLAKFKYLKGNNLQEQHSVTGRLGFAPYLAEYTELNTWIIFEASQKLNDPSSFDLTPLVRLFYNNFLTEIGYSLRGNVIFNFMTHL
jgi:hypothetical protein